MRKLIARASSGVWLNPHHRCPLAECLCCRSDHGTATPLDPAHPRGVLARCDPPGASCPEPSPLETLEGSKRLLDDVRDVLNLNRVYAAGLPLEAISPAKLFLKLAAACHCHALFQVVVPGRPASKPLAAETPLMCTARKHWKVAKKLCFCRMLKNAPAFAEAASRRQADAS